ncbi:heme exporter protein CcmD [Devosia rhodophyticola]|uniref:Heme exporter protein D n=1 Tax=Devosia rhodophyticola TaxID=3026423 RepID=A0ABY7YSW2_9HYPH|nr:heme exporter protein CcmD [Devosia rhodophyticola]WDR04430.1 heme exporter protein CcmD [Devosia rhodophyticola]
MIDLGPHAVFIIWAYVGSAIAVAGLVGAVLLDARRVSRRLTTLETQGVRRRSDNH